MIFLRVGGMSGEMDLATISNISSGPEESSNGFYHVGFCFSAMQATIDMGVMYVFDMLEDRFVYINFFAVLW